MSDADDNKMLEIIVTRASKEAVKYGLGRTALPPHVARGVADQLFFTIDLLKKGDKITSRQLAILLAQKGLGILKISSIGHWDCGIAIATALFAVLKFSAAGPASGFVQAVSLLCDCYNLDKTCGISDAVSAEINQRTLPIAIWLEQGTIGWINQGR